MGIKIWPTETLITAADNSCSPIMEVPNPLGGSFLFPLIFPIWIEVIIIEIISINNNNNYNKYICITILKYTISSNNNNNAYIYILLYIQAYT